MRKLVFTSVITLSFLLAGCGQVPKVVVSPIQQPVQFPKATDVRHVYVSAGPAGTMYSLKNQSETVAQIEKWLQTAKPVSVQLPPAPNPPIVSNANTNPAVLELQLSSHKLISISPTFYAVGHSQNLGKLYHFVNGVISYQDGGKTRYFKDIELYNWLTSNQWKRFSAK